MTANAGLDPISLEVVNNRLREIVAHMQHLLFHSGYSTILRESFDGSAGICDRDGYVVMASGAPYHLIPYYYCTRAVLERYPLGSLRDGDSFILTDPYSGGNLHVPDLVIVTPIFVGEQVLGFCVSIGHKTDLGGLVPGSSGAGAREIFHEGLLLPAVRYWTRDGVVPEIESILRRNSRAPDTVCGDIRAQVGCTRMGAERLRELCAEYRDENIFFAFDELQRLAERRLRQGLSAWPDGEAEAEHYADNDGVDLEHRLRLHVRVIKRGEDITIDYSGMNPQVRGPINLRPQHAETAALLALLSFLDPTIPINHGSRRPIAFVNPEGTITNARWPAPVNSYYWLMHAVYSVIQKALAEFNPERAVGTGGFGMGAMAVGYGQSRAGKQAIQYELIPTSLGASPAFDGTSPVQAMSHATPNTPVEVLETEYPIRVLRHEWTPDSSGAGLHRGGPGYVREMELQSDALLTLRMAHQFQHSGWGVFGGKAPPTARAFFNQGASDERALRPLETIEMHAGDRITLELPGGGGYGEPFGRPAELVLEDVLNGYITVEAAERDYGVVIDAATMTVDYTATQQRRSAH